MAALAIPMNDTGADSSEPDLGGILDAAAANGETFENTEDPVGEQNPPQQQEQIVQAAQPPASDAQTPEGIYPLAPDGNSYLVPKTELPRLQGLQKYAEAVQQRFPTAMDAEAAHVNANNFSGIMSDYLHGTDSDVDQVLNFLSGGSEQDPSRRAESLQAFTRFASRLPETLAKVSPEAHANLSNSIFQAQVASAYDKAAKTGDPNDFLKAQSLDWGKTGRYKTELPKFDPQKAQVDAFAKQQADFAQRQQAAMTRDWGSYSKTTSDGPKWTELDKRIDATLEPIKAKYNPVEFGAIRQQIKSGVLAKMSADSEWARIHTNEQRAIKNAYETAWKNQQFFDGLKPRVQAYQNDFLLRANRFLPSIAAPLLNQAAARVAAAPQGAKPPANSQKQPVQRAADGRYAGQQQNGKAVPFDLGKELDRLLQ